MSAITCTRCGRALKNPASIRKGMGPVCAAKAAKPGAFGRPAGINGADYRVVHVSPEFVWIEDIGADCRSITNDAEAVVAAIAAEFSDRRIIYKDSAGAWDELKHAGLIFTGFAPARNMAPRIAPSPSDTGPEPEAA